jgi:hypothetical protein
MSLSIQHFGGVEGVVQWKALKSQSSKKTSTVDLAAGCELLIHVFVQDFTHP